MGPVELTCPLDGVGQYSVGCVVLGVVEETVLNEGQINSYRDTQGGTRGSGQ